MFDQKVIDVIGVLAKTNPGNTPLERANVWHRDLVELTIDKACNLVKTIFDNLQKERLLRDDIETRILNAVNTGDIVLRNLNKSLKARIEKLIS